MTRRHATTKPPALHPFIVEHLHITEPYDYLPMLPETREMLRNFYEPYNQQLEQLLNHTMYW